MDADATGTQAAFDAAQIRRLRWRARRGLLENDLIIGRFLDRHETTLRAEEWHALQDLLELDDNTLLDVLLRGVEPPPDKSGPVQLRVLQWLRAA